MDDETFNLVKNILVSHFNIEEKDFDWDKPLQELNKYFVLLAQLVYFEQLIQERLHRKIPVLENISTNYHTPGDVVNLIKRHSGA